jgi:HK97 family phage major capsid protein
MSIDQVSADQMIDAIKEKSDRLRELREKSPEARSENWARDIKSTHAEVIALDGEIKAAQATYTRSAGRKTDGVDFPATEARSIGAQFVRSNEYSGRAGMQVGETRATLTVGDGTSGAGLFAPRATPISPIPYQRRLYVRDLLSVQDTDLLRVPYIQESNAATNELGACVVAENAAKRELTMEFTSAEAYVRKIAGWIPVTSEVMNSPVTLTGYVDTRLAYMVELRKEIQIISSPQTSPNLGGIITTTGIQTQAAVSGDYAATLGLSIGKCENVGADVNGIVMNTTDFWTMQTTRHSSQFDAGQMGSVPYGQVPETVYGRPVVRSASITAGTALVGDFRIGATLFEKGDIILSSTNSHSDYFIYNKWVLLAEQECALAVHRPDFFVLATL